jgi:Na+-driven multidrug efflux pump
MRNSMLLSTTLFFLTWFLLQSWGNLGLWIAFVCHFIYRALTLSFQFPSVSRSVESAA